MSDLELFTKVSFLFLSELLFEGWIGQTLEMEELNMLCMSLPTSRVGLRGGQVRGRLSRRTVLLGRAVWPSTAPNSRGLRLHARVLQRSTCSSRQDFQLWQTVVEDFLANKSVAVKCS